MRKISVHSRDACQHSAKRNRRTYFFSEKKGKHNMQLYDTVSQKCVTMRSEALLQSAKLKDLKNSSSYTGRTLKTLIFTSKRIWGDGKNGEKERCY